MLPHLSKKIIKPLRFKKIRSQLVFWFVILGLAPLLISVFITYHQYVHSIKQEAFNKLTAIRDLKVHEVENWMDVKDSWLKSMSENKEIRELTQSLQKDEFNSQDLQAMGNIRKMLKRHLANFNDFHELFILNKYSRKIIISTNSANEGLDEIEDPSLSKFLDSETLHTKNIHLSNFYNVPSMAFSIPIRCILHKKKHISSILVARVNLENSLYAILSNRTGLGRTGETLIVDKDVIALNELRTRNNAPLRYKVDGIPAIRASRGETGIAESIAYDGEKILAAYTYIPRTGWGFVAKQDLSELYSPIRSMMMIFIILITAVLLGILLVAFLTAKSIAAPVIEMTSSAQKIQRGDFTARNNITGSNELAFLGETFNTMADSIESMMKLRKINDEITQTLVDAKSMKELRNGILKQLVKVTNSQMGAYFVLNEDEGHYEPFTSIGLIPGVLKPFDAKTLEGELGMVFHTGKKIHIKDIPDDTIFSFRTFVGTIIPKEIISIPVTLNNIVHGIASLGSIKPYPSKILDILEQPWTTLFDTAFSNMRANEKTAKLAIELEKSNQRLQLRSEELQAQAEELQAQSEELHQTSEELQEQNHELEAQRIQVEEANRLKSEFLSNMSHELRTPLNSVMALSRVLLMQTKGKLSKDESHYLEIIERNGKNLLSLINDILDLSKIEAGRMDVTPRFFSIASTIETIMERLEPLAEEKGIMLSQTIPPDLPRIESDENRAHQILQNLIGNAVKFTANGSVRVELKNHGQTIIIKIIDTGIGIAQKELPHIFEEFRQVDGTSSRAYEGTGLGLAIAFKAAVMLGGGISVESTVGKGSVFTLTLPVRWRGTAPVSELTIFKSSRETILPQKKILVVDDEIESLTIISSHLAEAGYDIITAMSGKEAIGLAEKHHPFAITLDILMPEMDGWEVLQHLKQNPETEKIPVIIVSLSDHQPTGMALGAVGYVSKPVNQEMLIGEISRVAGPSPGSVLIADDNEIERIKILQTIENQGMTVFSTDNGNTCIDLIKKSPPDLLVLDLIMPGKSGFEVLKELRDAPETQNLPVIVLTAKDLTKDEKKKLNGNVSSILAKSDTTSFAVLEEIKKIINQIEHPQTLSSFQTCKASDRILLVEDSEAAIVQVKTVLEDEGYTVDVARGGKEALNYISHIIPGGIILDLMMPEVDGFEVLNEIRNTKTTANVPVLVLTARDLTPADLGKLTSNNIQQLIQKGDVDQDLLLFKIRLMLGYHPKVSLQAKAPDKKQFKSTTGKKKNGLGKISLTKKERCILLIEDNPDNMITIKAILNNKYRLLEAKEGKEGLKMVFSDNPDLVLLDISMPGMDGFAVAAEIRQNQKTANIPVIALTAHAMKGDREKIISADFDDYIAKPIHPEKLLQTINIWLKR